MSDLLSIVVPVFNTSNYLFRCVSSIMCQKYQPMEILLVDDGSTDGGDEICRWFEAEYDSVRFVKLKHVGLASVRNAGIERARGSYIGFVDSDDWIEVGMMKELMSNAWLYEADISCCNMYAALPDGTRREKNEVSFDGDTPLVVDGEDVLKKMYRMFSVCNKIFKMDLFDDVRFPDGKLFEDARTTYRLAAKAKRAVFSPYHGYNYYQRPLGIMGSLSREDLVDKILVWDEIADFVGAKIPEELETIAALKERVIADSAGVL